MLIQSSFQNGMFTVFKQLYEAAKSSSYSRHIVRTDACGHLKCSSVIHVALEKGEQYCQRVSFTHLILIVYTHISMRFSFTLWNILLSSTKCSVGLLSVYAFLHLYFVSITFYINILFSYSLQDLSRFMWKLSTSPLYKYYIYMYT